MCAAGWHKKVSMVSESGVVCWYEWVVVSRYARIVFAMALVSGAENRKPGEVVCGRRKSMCDIRMSLGGVGWGMKVGGSGGAAVVACSGG